MDYYPTTLYSRLYVDFLCPTYEGTPFISKMSYYFKTEYQTLELPTPTNPIDTHQLYYQSNAATSRLIELILYKNVNQIVKN